MFVTTYPQYDKLKIREYSAGFNNISILRPLPCIDFITRIDFSHNNLSEIPSFVFKITSLQVLVLSKNKIDFIPHDILRLKQLYTLNLTENPIEVLPPLPVGIVSVYMGFCHLREIPDMKENLCLTIFAAPGNNLDTIPNAPNLKTILLSRNRFTHFPQKLPRSIVYLDLSYNFIEHIPPLKLFNLEELDLSYNSIHEFTDDFEFPLLKFLKLGSNPIKETVLHPEKFKGIEICDITNTGISFESEPLTRQLFVSKSLPQYRSRHVKVMSSLPWLSFSEMKGSRPQMEDAMSVCALANGDADLYALCDGHGGDKTSAFSSLFLVDEIQRPDLKLSKKQLYEIIKKLNRSLRQRQYTDGSTMAMGLFNGKKLVTAHIGDTRIIVTTKDGKVSFVTIDHKSTSRGEYERIHLTGGRISSNRIHGILAPGRSLGDFIVPGTTDEPDIKTYKITPNDKWIIIGCDGVFDVLPNDKIAEFAKTSNSSSELAFDLRNLAFTEGSLDNISIIVVDITKREIPSGTKHINDDDDDDNLPKISITSSFTEDEFTGLTSSGSFTRSPSSDFFSYNINNFHIQSPLRNSEDSDNYSLPISKSMPSLIANNSNDSFGILNDEKFQTRNQQLISRKINRKDTNIVANSPLAPPQSILDNNGLYTMSSFVETDDEYED